MIDIKKEHSAAFSLRLFGGLQQEAAEVWTTL